MAIATTAAVLGSLLLSGPAPSGAAVARPVTGFEPVVRHSVSGDVAEIVSATPDGRTLVYSDSSVEEVGFVDIASVETPTELGTVGLDGSPTAVSVTPDGAYALVGVAGGANELTVVEVGTRARVTDLALSGQPDSIAISPDGHYAAVAIENERDEDVDEGLMPQGPAGALEIVDLVGEPGDWTSRVVDLTGLAGRFPDDPETEFVDIRAGVVALTLQENNHIVLVRLSDGNLVRHFSAGRVTHLADLTDDGTARFTEFLRDARREPDAIHWTPGGRLITANEGDYDLDLTEGEFVGGRGFTVYSSTGPILFDSGAGLERAANQAGVYDDGRSDAKGTEPEGIEIAIFRGQTFLFVGLERADAVVVYRLVGPTERPVLVEVLQTGDRPEGLLAIPRRNLFVSANEDDGTIDIFQATT
jgi:DNA-binding beta-propeller fold protein YncE